MNWNSGKAKSCNFSNTGSLHFFGGQMRNWRKFTWFILVVQVLFLVWIVAGVGDAANNCDGEVGDALELCQAGTAIGAGIGVGIIIFLWAFVDIILGLIWLVTNRGQRDCPVCGRAVKKGKTSCGKCGHNFAAPGSAAST